LILSYALALGGHVFDWIWVSLYSVPVASADTPPHFFSITSAPFILQTISNKYELQSVFLKISRGLYIVLTTRE
jgi:hypothetical protein